MKIAEAPSEAVTDRAGRHRVAGSLLAEGPATASDLAVRLGISATAVRRHLDSLMADGLVEASERPPYGPQPVRRRGRPAKTFSLTEDGRSQFPADYDELANAAMAFVRTMGGPAAVTAFAESRAVELEGQLRALLGPGWREASPQEQTAGMAQALSALGFAASVEPAPAGVQICQHHCPVSHVAGQFPELCEAETEAFARVLGRHVQRLATIAHGDGVCTTVIPLTTERTSA